MSCDPAGTEGRRVLGPGNLLASHLHELLILGLQDLVRVEGSEGISSGSYDRGHARHGSDASVLGAASEGSHGRQ